MSTNNDDPENKSYFEMETVFGVLQTPETPILSQTPKHGEVKQDD